MIRFIGAVAFLTIRNKDIKEADSQNFRHTLMRGRN